jgi:hypothetical protein
VYRHNRHLDVVRVSRRSLNFDAVDAMRDTATTVVKLRTGRFTEAFVVEEDELSVNPLVSPTSEIRVS